MSAKNQKPTVANNSNPEKIAAPRRRKVILETPPAKPQASTECKQTTEKSTKENVDPNPKTETQNSKDQTPKIEKRPYYNTRSASRTTTDKKPAQKDNVEAIKKAKPSSTASGSVGGQSQRNAKTPKGLKVDIRNLTANQVTERPIMSSKKQPQNTPSRQETKPEIKKQNIETEEKKKLAEPAVVEKSKKEDRPKVIKEELVTPVKESEESVVLEEGEYVSPKSEKSDTKSPERKEKIKSLVELLKERQARPKPRKSEEPVFPVFLKTAFKDTIISTHVLTQLYGLFTVADVRKYYKKDGSMTGSGAFRAPTKEINRIVKHAKDMPWKATKLVTFTPRENPNNEEMIEVFLSFLPRNASEEKLEKFLKERFDIKEMQAYYDIKSKFYGQAFVQLAYKNAVKLFEYSNSSTNNKNEIPGVYTFTALEISSA